MTAYTVGGVFRERNRPRPVMFQIFGAGRRDTERGTDEVGSQSWGRRRDTVFWYTAEEPRSRVLRSPARGAATPLRDDIAPRRRPPSGQQAIVSGTTHDCTL